MSNFYLGGDVSKGYCDFCLIDEDKNIVEKNFQLDDNYAGHQNLEKLIRKFTISHPDAEIYVGVESTGGYENNWLKFLRELADKGKLPVHSARINPKGTNHNSQAGLSRTITDKVSARNISEYLINHKRKIIYNKTDNLTAVRRQWTFIRLLVKQRTQYYNELNSYLYQANPETLNYSKDGYPQWLLKVLLRYPTAKQLSKAKLSILTTIPYVTKEKAEELVRRVKSSVASDTSDSTAESIKLIVGQIVHLEKMADAHVTLIKKDFPLQKEMLLLKSFIGIGDYSAMGLLMYIVNIDYFESAKHMTSFFGVHPVYKQSGDGTWGMHMSKQGQAEVRYILYLVALTAIQHNPAIKELYAKHMAKGINKTAALGICMHKILRMVFGMLKNKETFNPEKDKHLRESAVIKKGENKKDRRYQPISLEAPISQRQLKKRTKLLNKKEDPEPSQNDFVI